MAFFGGWSLMGQIMIERVATICSTLMYATIRVIAATSPRTKLLTAASITVIMYRAHKGLI